jgi:hypothetical protein
MGEIKQRGQIWLMYFVYVYENRTVNLVETVLRRGDKGERKRERE